MSWLLQLSFNTTMGIFLVMDRQFTQYNLSEISRSSGVFVEGCRKLVMQVKPYLLVIDSTGRFLICPQVGAAKIKSIFYLNLRLFAYIMM